jgi:hypothetical protein
MEVVRVRMTGGDYNIHRWNISRLFTLASTDS